MKKLIKCPLNYIGGKYKLLPQLLNKFPNKISMFFDVFGGGANVCLNVESEHVYYNDINFYLKDMFDGMADKNTNEIISSIESIINEYKLDKQNREGFEKLRDDYNNGLNSWEYLFVLICYSFNYQIRFNNDHKYNSSFGINRSSFTSNIKSNLIAFADKIHDVDIVFDSKDFRQVDYSDADGNDLIYFDPPYYLSCGVYQDGKRGFSGWNEKDEKDLYALCDKLDEQGTRFAVSNLLCSKGNTNTILEDWSKKYFVHYIDMSYKNSNYQRKTDKQDVEVLITNYQI